MSPRTLEQLAATIAIPTERGAAARAYVESVHTPGRRLANGYPAGQGGRTQYRVWFGLDGGRVREPVPVLFDRDRDAVALARLLNGDVVPAARPAPQSDLRHGMGADPAPLPGVVAEPTGLSAAASLSAGPQPRPCVVCGRELPPGSRPQRTTCGATCRKALERHGSGGAAARPAAKTPDVDTDSGPNVVSQFLAAPRPAQTVEA